MSMQTCLLIDDFIKRNVQVLAQQSPILITKEKDLAQEEEIGRGSSKIFYRAHFGEILWKCKHP
jgi:hypothetical protein